MEVVMKITKKYLQRLILEEIDRTIEEETHAGMEKAPMTLWELHTHLRPVAENWAGNPEYKKILMQASEILKLESGVFE
jgi:hypothetical protein